MQQYDNHSRMRKEQENVLKGKRGLSNSKTEQRCVCGWGI